MEAVEILTREHGRVRAVAAAVRGGIAAESGGGTSTVLGDLGRLLDFFSFYSSSCHEPKEEELLFAALHRRGMAWDAPPLRDLVMEHAELHIALQSAEDWLPLARSGDVTARESLLHDLEVYLQLLETHLEKEDAILFPATPRWLTADDLEVLSDAFTAIARSERDQGVYAHYADLAHELAGTAHP